MITRYLKPNLVLSSEDMGVHFKHNPTCPTEAKNNDNETGLGLLLI